jgi:uncharacterized protein YnzC (UPF0291/DUF896 family)
MISDEKIARINALSKKSKTPEGLTEAEKAEQAALRREYVDAVKASLQNQLDHTTVVDVHGNHQKLKQKDQADTQQPEAPSAQQSPS